jgi:hypothetical protein
MKVTEKKFACFGNHIEDGWTESVLFREDLYPFNICLINIVIDDIGVV